MNNAISKPHHPSSTSHAKSGKPPRVIYTRHWLGPKPVNKAKPYINKILQIRNPLFLKSRSLDKSRSRALRSLRIKFGYGYGLDVPEELIMHRLASGCKDLHYLSKLHLSVTNLDSRYMHQLLCSIKRLKCLSVLSIEFNDEIHSSNSSLDHLIQALPSLKRLQTLAIQFQRSALMDKELLKLSASIKQLPILSNLALEHNRYHQDKFHTTNIALKNLLYDLKRCRSLNELIFSLRGCKYGDDKIISDQFSHIGHLKSLINLSVDLRNPHISSKDSQDMLSAIKNIDSLKTLTLALYAPTSDTQTPQCTLLYPKSLEKLSISYLSGQGMSERSMRNLTSDWCNLNHLLALSFVMYSSENSPQASTAAKDNVLRVLFVELSKLQSLASLILRLDNPPSGLAVSRSLPLCLKSLRNLNKLTLIPRVYYGATDDDIAQLSEVLHQINILHHFELEIWRPNNNLTDRTLQRLFEGIRRNPNLHTLVVSIVDCSRITDKALKSFAQGLKALKLLTSLHLKISMCSSITEAGLTSLFDGLKELKCLTEFGLCSWRGPKFDFHVIKKLSISLQQLPHLHSVDFYLRRCTDLKGLYYLFRNVCNLKSLEKFRFDLCLHDEAPYIDFRSLFHHLKGLPLLKEVDLRYECRGSSVEVPRVSREILGAHRMNIALVLDY